MRKRNIRIQVRLNEIEYAKLMEDIVKEQETISNHIRKLIVGAKLKEKPDFEFYKIMKDFVKIGTNLNQIAKKANETNQIDKDFYFIQVKEWRKLVDGLKKRYY